MGSSGEDIRPAGHRRPYIVALAAPSPLSSSSSSLTSFTLVGSHVKALGGVGRRWEALRGVGEAWGGGVGYQLDHPLINMNHLPGAFVVVVVVDTVVAIDVDAVTLGVAIVTIRLASASVANERENNLKFIHSSNQAAAA